MSNTAGYGSFQRVITLPSDADVNHIDATFKNGVVGIEVEGSFLAWHKAECF